MYRRQLFWEGFLPAWRQPEGNCCAISRYESSYGQNQLFWKDLLTSTGGAKIEGEDESYDFGSGAGFYVDATAEPWSKNYKMYSYVTEELPATVFEHFKQLDSSRVSITGHSMGGHGALSLYLRNPGKYKSVSAFAPIANPLKAPWGEKAFKGYFGEQDWQSKGAEHDSTELLKKWKGGPLDILIDVVSYTFTLLETHGWFEL